MSVATETCDYYGGQTGPLGGAHRRCSAWDHSTDLMIEISEVREDKLPEVAALYQQLTPTDASVPNMRLVLSRNEDHPSHVVWAARRDGRLVGSLLAVTREMLLGPCRSFIMVEDVVVDLSHRPHGTRDGVAAYGRRLRQGP